MRLRDADRLRPGSAPVADHSRFAAVARATPVTWVERDPTELPPGSGRIVVELGGRWERKADDDEWRKVVVPDNFGADEEFSSYFGAMWYRRKFADPRVDAPEGNPQRARLCFCLLYTSDAADE